MKLEKFLAFDGLSSIKLYWHANEYHSLTSDLVLLHTNNNINQQKKTAYSNQFNSLTQQANQQGNQQKNKKKNIILNKLSRPTGPVNLQDIIQNNIQSNLLVFEAYIFLDLNLRK